MKIFKELQRYSKGRQGYLSLALMLSALSSILGLLPFIFIWLIVRSLLPSGGDVEQTNIGPYAWFAFGSAATSIVFYFLGLMSSYKT